MRCVQQDARAGKVVKRVETRVSGIEAPNIDTGAELQLEQAHDVVDGCQTQSEPLPQLQGILLGLVHDIAGQKRPLGEVETCALDA